MKSIRILSLRTSRKYHSLYFEPRWTKPSSYFVRRIGLNVSKYTKSSINLELSLWIRGLSVRICLISIGNYALKPQWPFRLLRAIGCNV